MKKEERKKKVGYKVASNERRLKKICFSEKKRLSFAATDSDTATL